MSIEKLLERAKALYANESLKYHNWSHVQDVLRAAKDVLGDTSPELTLAIAYHDCVYVPHSQPGINEELSALTFKNIANDIGYTDVNIDLVLETIKATKVANHVSPTFMLETCERFSDRPVYWRTIGRMLDADLSSLAAPWNQFVRNQWNIITEQIGSSGEVPLPVLTMSVSFLLQFLDCRPTIFFTKEGQIQWEKTARKNIENWASGNGVVYHRGAAHDSWSTEVTET